MFPSRRPRPGKAAGSVRRLVRPDGVPYVADGAVADQCNVEARVGAMPVGMLRESNGCGFEQARLLAGLQGVGGLTE